MSCVSKIVNRKIIFWIVLICSVASIAPVLYCGLFDYANGDDLIGAATARQAYINGASITEYFGNVMKATIDNYYSWDGNFASTFVWYAFEPSIFCEKLYRIVPFLALSCISSIVFATAYFGKKYLGISEIGMCVISIPIVSLIINYAPSIKSLMFWWTGIVSYIFPIGLLCLSLVWIDKYFENRKKRYLIFVSLSMIFIGGAGYFSAIIVFEVFVLIFLWQVISNRDNLKKCEGLIIPFVVFMLCFIISFLAPGNSARAATSGVEISFSISKVIYTVFDCIIVGGKEIFIRLIDIRPLFLFFISVPFVTWYLLDIDTCKLTFKYPILTSVCLILIYFSSYAPMLFTGVEVSGGGPNDIYIFFLTIFTLVEVYVTGYFKRKLTCKNSGSVLLSREWTKKCIGIPLVFCVFLFIFIFGRYLIGNSSGYMCYQFASSGALHDFDVQMQERIAILQSEEKDVVLPQMNDDQGPFMHMPLTGDASSYPNQATSLFYGKDSVIAISRDEWNEKYGGK